MRRLALYVLCALLLSFPARAGEIIIQSTTSTQNSGLFDDLLPVFSAKTNIAVKVIAVGTGQAIRNAMNGDGDVLFVHSTDDEEKFVADGYGVARFDVMYNDFILVGPGTDPAGVKNSADILAAFHSIASAGERGDSLFISRGDNSGTHKKEQSLWKAADIYPADIYQEGAWYREAGAGMGATLNIAAASDGYCLVDRATWNAFGNKEGLEVVFEGDSRLFNQYGIILVDSARHSHVNARDGQIFIDWVLGPEGQDLINQFRADGEQVFTANAK